jgi:hypothetical protein
MAWTFNQLKAAIAALSPVPDGVSAIAAAINAQTVTATGAPFQWLAAKVLARTAPTGDWARIVARSRQTPTLPPVTPTDAAILAAINATESGDTDLIDPGSTATWAAFQGGISALEASGDLASATASAILALADPTLPAWQPPVTEGDIQTAMAQP